MILPSPPPYLVDSWAFRLAERLDQSTLDEVRSRLGMQPSGRLTDSWDELFGEVRRMVNGRWAQVDLWRDVDTSEWRIDVEMPADLPEVQVARTLAEVREAVSSVGLTIVSSLKRPSTAAAIGGLTWQDAVVGRAKWTQPPC